MQLHELRQYVARQGWQVFAEYVDTGFSGASASRPRLEQLLRARAAPRRTPSSAHSAARNRLLTTIPAPTNITTPRVNTSSQPQYWVGCRNTRTI